MGVGVYECLWSVAWQPKLESPTPCSTNDQGDQEVARVGRPATNYKIVVKPWESGF